MAQSIITFFVGVAFFVFALLVWSTIRAGSVDKARAHFDVSGAISDWKAVVFGLAVLVGALALVSQAKADDDLRFFGAVDLFAGIDYVDDSPQCQPSGLDNALTSNLGVRVHLVEGRDVRLAAKYTHHSCAINRDRNGYDGYGVELNIRFNSPLRVLSPGR